MRSLKLLVQPLLSAVGIESSPVCTALLVAIHIYIYMFIDIYQEGVDGWGNKVRLRHSMRRPGVSDVQWKRAMLDAGDLSQTGWELSAALALAPQAAQIRLFTSPW